MATSSASESKFVLTTQDVSVSGGWGMSYVDGIRDTAINFLGNTKPENDTVFLLSYLYVWHQKDIPGTTACEPDQFFGANFELCKEAYNASTFVIKHSADTPTVEFAALLSEGLKSNKKTLGFENWTRALRWWITNYPKVWGDGCETPPIYLSMAWTDFVTELLAFHTCNSRSHTSPALNKPRRSTLRSRAQILAGIITDATEKLEHLTNDKRVKNSLFPLSVLWPVPRSQNTSVLELGARLERLNFADEAKVREELGWVERTMKLNPILGMNWKRTNSMPPIIGMEWKTPLCSQNMGTADVLARVWTEAVSTYAICYETLYSNVRIASPQVSWIRRDSLRQGSVNTDLGYVSLPVYLIPQTEEICGYLTTLESVLEHLANGAQNCPGFLGLNDASVDVREDKLPFSFFWALTK